jgi:hypothetical protein
VTRVFYPISVSFTGPGFYATDTDRRRRTIIWQRKLHPDDPAYSLRVLPLPLDAVLGELTIGTAHSTLEKAPELMTFLSWLNDQP